MNKDLCKSLLHFLTSCNNLRLLVRLKEEKIAFGSDTYWLGSKSEYSVICCFLFFVFFFLNWRLIALQYCSGFLHTLTWISHGCTNVLSVHACVHVYAHVYLRSFMHALLTQAPLQSSKCLSNFLTGNAPDYWYTLTFLHEKSRI